MFERFTEPARQAVVFAQEEARTLGHHHIGTEHLLLGVMRADPTILADAPEAVRARIDPGPGSAPTQMPFTAGAKAALERASRQPDAMGHAAIAPGHLLLALADDPQALRAADAPPEALRGAALTRLAATPPPKRKRFDLDATIADGVPVEVRLGDHELPIGDLGNPRSTPRSCSPCSPRKEAAPSCCASTGSTRRSFAARSAARDAAGGVVRALSGNASRDDAEAANHVGRLAYALPAKPDSLIQEAVAAE